MLLIKWAIQWTLAAKRNNCSLLIMIHKWTSSSTIIYKACSVAWTGELSAIFVLKLKQCSSSYLFRHFWWILRHFLCPLTYFHTNVLWASIHGIGFTKFISSSMIIPNQRQCSHSNAARTSMLPDSWNSHGSYDREQSLHLRCKALCASHSLAQHDLDLQGYHVFAHYPTVLTNQKRSESVSIMHSR